jgi:hypothetical protein
MPINSPIETNEGVDYAQQVTDRLADEYRHFQTTLEDLHNEIRHMPAIVNNDQDVLLIGSLIKRMRDFDSRVEAVRVLEKEPYLRGGNAVDSFFLSIRDQIGKRNKSDRKAKNGMTDDLMALINVYQDKKIAEERARMLAEQEKARKAAEAAAAAQRAAEAKQREAEAAIARARSEESRKAREAEAARAAEAAAQAEIERQRQAEAAEDARLASLAKPSDIARVRGSAAGGAGVTATVGQVPYAELVDRNKLDLNVLRPFFTDEALEKALKAWARTTGHRVMMDGAAIGFRNKGSIR